MYAKYSFQWRWDENLFYIKYPNAIRISWVWCYKYLFVDWNMFNRRVFAICTMETAITACIVRLVTFLMMNARIMLFQRISLIFARNYWNYHRNSSIKLMIMETLSVKRVLRACVFVLLERGITLFFISHSLLTICIAVAACKVNNANNSTHLIQNATT